MKFSAAGDYLGQIRLFDYEGLKEVKDFISDTDARFVNLETTLHRGGEGIHGNTSCGGSYLFADPDILDDVKAYGFNMLSYANNHAFDYGENGFKSTYKAVKASGIVNAGAGMSLEEASAPDYLDTPNGRVALIGVTASFSPDWIAGYSSKNFEGRPGVNGLRTNSRIQVKPEQFKVIKEAVENSLVNTAMNISRSEGYTPAEKEGELMVNKVLTFCEGPTEAFIQTVNETDMSRILASIKEARKNADFVLVSIHSHAVGGHSKEDVLDFMKDFCHRCIDEGADAILGHGPHIIRAMEIYKDRPVFYSLGDFILQNEYTPVGPADYFIKNGVPVDSPMQEMFAKRSLNGKRGLKYTPAANEAVIVRFELGDGSSGKLKSIDILPIELGLGDESRKGLPAPCFDKGILERFVSLSKPFGTEIEIDGNGMGHVVL